MIQSRKIGPGLQAAALRLAATCPLPPPGVPAGAPRFPPAARRRRVVPQGAGRPLLALPTAAAPPPARPQLPRRRGSRFPIANVVTGMAKSCCAAMHLANFFDFHALHLHVRGTTCIIGINSVEPLPASSIIPTNNLRDGRVFDGALLPSLEGRGRRHGRGGGGERRLGLQRGPPSVTGLGLQQ